MKMNSYCWCTAAMAALCLLMAAIRPVVGSPAPTPTASASAWTSSSSANVAGASVHRHQLRNKKQASRWLFRMLRPDGGGGPSSSDLGRSGGSDSGGGADVSAFDTLYEAPESKFDPLPRDLAPGWRLRAQLGSEFDPEYMSVRKPMDAYYFPNGTTESAFKLGGTGGGGSGGKNRIPVPKDAVMPAYIRRLNLKYFNLPDGDTVRTKMSRKLRRKMKRFLWSYTACPVVYQWRDLGPRIWPRWIKQGRCQSKVSCSIPAGMTCRPKETSSKTLLRWHCADYDRRDDCRWLPFRYRVVTECQCGCGANSSSSSTSASRGEDDVVFNEIA